MSGFTDIRAEGWVARLPERARAFALLARFDRPIGAWLLFLPGLWSITAAAPGLWSWAWLILRFALGAVVMRGAGCVVNDLWDRDLDRQVERTASRPLAAGLLRTRDALGFLAILLAIGLAILLTLRPIAELLGVLSLVPVALYPLAKRVTWWPQVVLGITFGWAAPMGYAAATGRLDAEALLLYLAAIFWILGYDTIYAHQDREDDALIGVGSTARLFATTTKPFLAACYAITLLLLMLAIRSLLGIAVLAIPAAMLAWQIVALDVDDKAGCLRLFKANKAVGLAVAAAILVGRL